MKLLNLCKGFEMQIANGRFTGDFWEDLLEICGEISHTITKIKVPQRSMWP